MFDFSKYLTKSKYCDITNKWVIGKLKDEIVCVALKESLGLKPKMYSFLVENCDHKKAKGIEMFLH